MGLRSDTIRLAHAKPELRKHLLPILVASGKEIELSDDELLAVAEEVAKKDPKKRFTPFAIRQYLKERENADYVRLKGPEVERRLDALAKQRKIVPDARGTFKIPNRTQGVGIEFRNEGQGNLSILQNGELVGEILYGDGEFIGATRQREKVYEVVLDIEGRDFTGSKAPPSFKKLTEAKAWVKRTLEP